MTDGDDLPIFPETVAWDEAQAALDALELGDGLPLVPPTLSRFDAMVSGRGPTGRSFGHVLPLMGELTLEAVAYNCILAGCRPEELPVVLTAVEAALEDRFNLLGVLSTTGTATVAVCVHGPVVGALESQRRRQYPRTRQPGECLYRPRRKPDHAECRGRAGRGRRHGDDGPARQIHLLFRGGDAQRVSAFADAPRFRCRRKLRYGAGRVRYGRGSSRPVPAGRPSWYCSRSRSR